METNDEVGVHVAKRREKWRIETKVRLQSNRYVLFLCTLFDELINRGGPVSLSLRLSNNDNRTGVGPFLGEEYNVRSRVAENEKRESARPWMWPRLRVGNVQFDVF